MTRGLRYRKSGELQSGVGVSAGEKQMLFMNTLISCVGIVRGISDWGKEKDTAANGEIKK